MLCNFKDCNIGAAAVTYLFFLCNFKGHFHLYLKLPICTKNVCNPKANRDLGYIKRLYRFIDSLFLLIIHPEPVRQL